MGDRSGVTGDTLGSEARSVTSDFNDDEQSSRGGLPSTPEGEEGGPPSPNATESEGSATEVAQKAAEIQKLPWPVKSGRKSGGWSWLTHSDEFALAVTPGTFSRDRQLLLSQAQSLTPQLQAIPDSHRHGEGSKSAAATHTQG